MTKNLSVCWTAVFALLLSVVANLAHAQTYSCKNSSGRYVASSSPCSSIATSGMVYYPPIEQPTYGYPQGQRYEKPVQRAQDPDSFVQYMNPRCAGLNDALRTASARGIPYEKISDMRREYTKNCQEEEGEARERLSNANTEKRQQKLDDKRNEKLDQERASLKAQQCGESKRILVTKKARTDLNEGEKAELRRFEENYRTRCG